MSDAESRFSLNFVNCLSSIFCISPPSLSDWRTLTADYYWIWVSYLSLIIILSNSSISLLKLFYVSEWFINLKTALSSLINCNSSPLKPRYELILRRQTGHKANGLLSASSSYELPFIKHSYPWQWRMESTWDISWQAVLIARYYTCLAILEVNIRSFFDSWAKLGWCRA